MAKSSGPAEAPHNPHKRSRRPNPVDIHVGGRVRFRRMLLGMSQEKLGEKVGLTFQQIQKYEKGANRIGASRLFEIARALGVTVQFFFEEAPRTAPLQVTDSDPVDTPTEISVVEFLRSREGLALNSTFVRISHAKAQRAIIELVGSLANWDASDNCRPSSFRQLAEPERAKKNKDI